MSTEQSKAGMSGGAPGADGRDTLSVFDLLIVLGESKFTFLVISVLGSLAALTYALSLQRFYSAETLVLPPQQQSQMMGSLAQLGALVGGGGNAALKNTDEMYVAFLKTRRLQDALIARFKLQERYGASTMMEARNALSSMVGVTSDRKSGLIRIAVDDVDAKMAADLANAHVEELKKLLSSLAVTEAQQRRSFFEAQVAKTRNDLVAAELAFRKAQAESGLVVSEVLKESGIRGGVDLRSKIASREVQLQALNRFATPENPDYQRLQAELVALKQQLLKLEGGSGMVPASKEGENGVAALQAYRNLKVQEATLEALIKQYEVARLDESREGPLLQQVDVALPPERPAKPKRAGILVWGVAFSVVVGGMIALWRGLARRRRQQQVVSSEWQQVKRAWLKTV